MERHGERVWRIGLDGGFGCPNREAGRGRGGCVYCSGRAARATYLDHQPSAPPSIAAQVESGLAFLRQRYGARLFMPYFQAYSSTWAAVKILRDRYDEALAALKALAPGACRGLVVSTRPDCVDGEVAALLESYAARGLETWVELGLQSGLDSTLERIGRGHDVACFERAVALLKDRGLRLAAHLILGLPGESRASMLSGPRLVASLGLDGVKFHDLHIPRDSPLAGDYLGGELCILAPDRYLDILAVAIELIPPGTEVIRIDTDTLQDERLAPRRPLEKTAIHGRLEDLLAARGTRQGARWHSG